MDEFDFINKITPKKRKHPNIKMGIGDDAAIYRPDSEKDQVVCVDTMVEGVHFLKHLSTPYEVGYKALAVNISDIAAMGGVPLYYLVAISIPNTWKESELIDIFQGMNEIASHYNMSLIGGDTVSTSKDLVVTVTVIGEVEQNVRTLRSKAEDGDIVFVTGTVGDSSAGLDILLGKYVIDDASIKEYLIERHKRPTPQVKAGRIISSVKRASLNDISDGLASELHEIAESSQVGIIINEEDLPISQELSQIKQTCDITKWMFYGGEDFELVGTTSPESWEQLKRLCNEQSIKITKIGYVSKKYTGVYLKKKNKGGEPLHKSGFNHFKK